MKHIIDTEQIEKLIKTETDKGWYSVPVDDLRALIANSPQADEMVKDLSKIARQLSSLADNGVTETLPDAMREASKQIFARLSNKTTGAETLLSAYKPQADDVRKDAERYQWLCENKLMPWGLILDEKDLYELGIDGAIDKARE